MHFMSRFTAILLIVSTLAASPALARAPEATADDLQFTANRNGTFDIAAKQIPLEIVLAKIGQATGVKVFVDETTRKQPVTINASGATLVEILRTIAGENYAMVFSGRRVAELHVLPKGKPSPSDRRASYSDFAGQVRVTNQRARMFFMPDSASEEAVNTYIQLRHEALSRLSQREPHKQLQAQISFPAYVSGEQLLSFVKENQLDPITLNIGWKENGGGYDLKEGESIDSAIESAEQHHGRFVAQLVEDADAHIQSLRRQGLPDEQIKSGIGFQQSAHELNAIRIEKGTPFYGIRVSATAEHLDSLAGDERTVRLVDPLWGGAVEEEISGTYPTAKIAIPLTPANEKFTH